MSTYRSPRTRLSPLERYWSPEFSLDDILRNDPLFTPFWMELSGVQYNNLGILCLRYLKDKYGDTVCCINEGLTVNYYNSEEYAKISVFRDLPEKIHMCMVSVSEVVVLKYNIFSFGYVGGECLMGHSCIVIINKFRGTIEFFDSNGSESHFNFYRDKDYLAIRNFLHKMLPDYTYLTFEESCPRLGFQHYESRTPKSKYDRSGYCMIWSMFLAELRVKYFKEDPVEVQNTYISDLSRIHGDGLSEYLRVFIRNYAVHMYRKCRPYVEARERMRITHVSLYPETIKRQVRRAAPEAPRKSRRLSIE
jgi:hypothetical protein